jgi:hypothetical protein
MRLPGHVKRLIEEAIAQLEPQPLGHINYEGRRHTALPLFGTLGEVWLLRPDGSLWRVDSEWGLTLEPLPTDLHTPAIIAGARLYPWLAAVLPQRPSTAVDCTECGGAGTVGPGSAWFCRTCGGLGWVNG